MTDATITTTLTFADLIDQYDDELDDLRGAYEDVVEYARDEHGDERAGWPDDLRQQARLYDEAGKQIQRRQHALEQLREEYDGASFGIAMLTGAELMDVETELRMEAQRRDTQPGALQAYRQQLVVDAATVEAPGAVPRDDEGSPVPSECPNPLTLALHEQVEALNTAGMADFRAPGFGDETAGVGSVSSASPASSASTSSALDPSDGDDPPTGTDS